MLAGRPANTEAEATADSENAASTKAPSRAGTIISGPWPRHALTRSRQSRPTTCRVRLKNVCIEKNMMNGGETDLPDGSVTSTVVPVVVRAHTGG